MSRGYRPPRALGPLLILSGSVSGCDCRPEVAHPLAAAQASALPAESDPSFVKLRARLAPLHARKQPPQPGDWLAEHVEPGQTFEAYRREGPITPDGDDGPRRVLYIQPLGELGLAHRSVVENVTTYLSLFFGLDVRVRPRLPLSLVPAEARRIRGDTRQVLSPFILRELLAPRLPPDAAAYISFTAEDLWPGDGWTFVFGQASLQDRVGVWSMHRYGDPLQGPVSLRRILRRTLRVATHETAHMFSLRHCTAYECVMNGSNDLEEADRGPLWLCPECLAKVLWATDQAPADRFEQLSAFAAAHGLEREAAFFQRSATRLRAGR